MPAQTFGFAYLRCLDGSCLRLLQTECRITRTSRVDRAAQKRSASQSPLGGAAIGPSAEIDSSGATFAAPDAAAEYAPR
jgi:hypothetical protein